MTSGQRARYYRDIHAAETVALEQTTQSLRHQVDQLDRQLGLRRQLVECALPSRSSRQILDFVSDFVDHGIHTRRLGLQQPVVEIQSIRFQGDTHAPVVRVDVVASGKLTTAVAHRIYACVLGNSIVLDALIHDEVRYDCSFVFLFSMDGLLEREHVEVGTIMGLRGPLQSLKTVAQVVSQVNVPPDVG